MSNNRIGTSKRQARKTETYSEIVIKAYALGQERFAPLLEALDIPPAYKTTLSIMAALAYRFGPAKNSMGTFNPGIDDARFMGTGIEVGDYIVILSKSAAEPLGINLETLYGILLELENSGLIVCAVRNKYMADGPQPATKWKFGPTVLELIKDKLVK